MDPLNQSLDLFRENLVKFVTFNDEEWLLFSQHLQYKTLKKKDFFIKAGQVCDEISFIVSGSVRFYHVKNGEEISNYFCFDHELVSSYKSFLTRQPNIVYVQALESTQLISFTHSSLQQMLKNEKLAYKMERFGRLIAEHLICCYEDRLTAFIIQTPEERYLQLLNSGTMIMQRIPQHYIAQFLGITPVSLSRIRKRICLPEVKG
ncbi:Crp/Fnr family transcriptional regulator [Mucilaginibacter sp.]|uniref:Crp/Fnr family transcriptional regulator n=1 Tax=Mucilaginibacter sp. TaxID=1882438 RepID=UPI003B002217